MCPLHLVDPGTTQDVGLSIKWVIACTLSGLVFIRIYFSRFLLSLVFLRVQLFDKCTVDCNADMILRQNMRTLTDIILGKLTYCDAIFINFFMSCTLFERWFAKHNSVATQN